MSNKSSGTSGEIRPSSRLAWPDSAGSLVAWLLVAACVLGLCAVLLRVAPVGALGELPTIDWKRLHVSYAIFCFPLLLTQTSDWSRLSPAVLLAAVAAYFAASGFVAIRATVLGGYALYIMWAIGRGRGSLWLRLFPRQIGIAWIAGAYLLSSTGFGRGALGTVTPIVAFTALACSTGEVADRRSDWVALGVTVLAIAGIVVAILSPEVGVALLLLGGLLSFTLSRASEPQSGWVRVARALQQTYFTAFMGALIALLVFSWIQRSRVPGLAPATIHYAVLVASAGWFYELARDTPRARWGLLTFGFGSHVAVAAEALRNVISFIPDIASLLTMLLGTLVAFVGLALIIGAPKRTSRDRGPGAAGVFE